VSFLAAPWVFEAVLGGLVAAVVAGGRLVRRRWTLRDTTGGANAPTVELAQLRPGEVARLLASDADYAATFVDLVERGLIELEEDSRSSLLGNSEVLVARCVDRDWLPLNYHESLLLAALFHGRHEVVIDHLHRDNGYQSRVRSFRRNLRSQLVEAGLVRPRPPLGPPSLWLLPGIALILFGWWTFSRGGGDDTLAMSPLASYGAVAAGLLLVGVGHAIPVQTAGGQLAADSILALCESHRSQIEAGDIAWALALRVPLPQEARLTGLGPGSWRRHRMAIAKLNPWAADSPPDELRG
jgi:hypothetical protein